MEHFILIYGYETWLIRSDKVDRLEVFYQYWFSHLAKDGLINVQHWHIQAYIHEADKASSFSTRLFL